MTTYYWDMDGVLADFHKNYNGNRALAFSRDYLANLDPFTKNVAVLRKMLKSGIPCYILTKAANEDARDGKVDWLAKYVPELTADRFICIVGYGRKVDYIREDGILIDDDEKNTKQWVKGGHEAILLTYKGEAVAL